MDLKMEFIQLALQPGRNMSELCRRYGISRRIGYKWLARYKSCGAKGLCDQSRRPKQHPNALTENQRQIILSSARKKPHWGAHKLYHWLKQKGEMNLPSQSSFHRVLLRAGLVNEVDSHKHFHRFEHAHPNDLWQIDFKGHFAMDIGRCHPLTILDDHSRFSLGIKGCTNERAVTVKSHLSSVFKGYGLPRRINFDNGPPWGKGNGLCSSLGAWLIRLGISVSYSSPYHPQTNGKIERFHRSLKSELLRYQHYRDLEEMNIVFENWRHEYNFERPHCALDMKTPSKRYTMSKRSFPQNLPEIAYDTPGDQVRKVCSRGFIKFKSHQIRIGESLQREYVVVRRLIGDDVYGIYYCHQLLLKIKLDEYKKLQRWESKCVTHVLEEVLPIY